MIRRQHQNEAHRRTALYARNSQLKTLGEILALQEQLYRSTHCLEHGYIVPHDQLYYKVRAGSADSDRFELTRLGEAVRQGCIVVVTVSSFDRLARGPAESTIFVKEFKAAEVTIKTAGE